jgi:hypothetical protein
VKVEPEAKDTPVVSNTLMAVIAEVLRQRLTEASTPVDVLARQRTVL